MMAARPMLAAKAASPRQRMTAGRRGDCREPRRVQQTWPTLHQPHATDREESEEPHRKPHRDGQRGEVDSVVAAESDRQREQQHGQDVVYHRGAQDRPGGPPAEHVELDQHCRRDAHARRNERHTDEHRRGRILAGGDGEREPSGERKHTPSPPTSNGRAPDLAHLRQPRLEANPEQQEDDAQLREHLEHLARVHEAQHGRPHDHAGKNLADDRRLTEPLEQLVPELGREQHHEQIRENRRSVGGRGDRGSRHEPGYGAGVTRSPCSCAASSPDGPGRSAATAGRERRPGPAVEEA